MITQSEFYAAKLPDPVYDCFTLSHSAFSEPYRLVANQYADMTLNGAVYKAAPMDIGLSDSDAENPAVTASFPRLVVGREFNAATKRITDAGRMEPIEAKYERFIPTVQTGPVKKRTLHVVDSGGIVKTGETVSVKAGQVNKMTMGVADIYDVSIFTGLETV